MAQATTVLPEKAPGRGERALSGIAVGALALFGVLLVVVWRLSGPIRLDDALGWSTRNPNAQVLPVTWFGHGWYQLHHLAVLGSPWFAFTALVAVALLAYVARDYVAVALCAVGPAIAGLCELVAKPAVGRTNAAGLSFPSGHATLAAAVATAVVVVAYRLGGVRFAAVAAVPAAVVPALVSIAVVRLGWHYPTDAIGGTALGVGIVCATAALLAHLSLKIG